MKSDIFKKNYEHYVAQLAQVDFSAAKEILGLKQEDDRFFLPFFGDDYMVSKNGIQDSSGNRPSYSVCVILSKYLTLCPDRIYLNTEWTAFRDFKRTSHFLNVNYFASDTEQAMASAFSGRLDNVFQAAGELDGKPENGLFQYDLVMQFKALPRISLLLLFNEGDEDFGANGTVLFQRQAEHYLDPESIAVTSAYLVKRLKEEAGLIQDRS